MSRTIRVTFDCADPEGLSRFWAAVLGYVNPGPPGHDAATGRDVFDAWHEFLGRVGVPENEWNSKPAAEDPDGTGPRLFSQRVPEGKIVKNRVHLDVRAAPGLDASTSRALRRAAVHFADPPASARCRSALRSCVMTATRGRRRTPRGAHR